MLFYTTGEILAEAVAKDVPGHAPYAMAQRVETIRQAAGGALSGIIGSRNRHRGAPHGGYLVSVSSESASLRSVSRGFSVENG